MCLLRIVGEKKRWRSNWIHFGRRIKMLIGMLCCPPEGRYAILLNPLRSPSL